jgi:hypothetical protein
MAEVKFREIAMQMLLATMLLRAEHAALEYAEIAFDGVRGDYGIAFAAKRIRPLGG